MLSTSKMYKFLQSSIVHTSLTVVSSALNVYFQPFSTFEEFLFIVYGFGITTFGQLFINFALTTLPAYMVSVAGLLYPVLASLLGWVIYAEVPHVGVFVGGGLVLVGCAVAIVGGIGSEEKKSGNTEEEDGEKDEGCSVGSVERVDKS